TPPRTNNHQTGVPDYSVVESGDGYIDDEVRNICFTNDQYDRLSVVANEYAIGGPRSPSFKRRCSCTAGSRTIVLLSLNARQEAIENRLKSHGCCGAIGRTPNSPNRDSSSLAELNSHIAEIERDLRETATAPRRLSAVQPRPPVTFANSHVRTYSSPPPPTCDRTYTRTISTTNNKPNFNANIGVEIRDRRNYGNTDHASSTRVGTASHYSDRRSTQFYDMPNSDSVNTVFPNSQTHYPERCTGQPETLASMRNPAFSFNFKLTPPQFAGKKYEDPKNFIQNCESVFRNSGVPPSE
ncbi:Uncharacterized protein FWK35_00037481, partial [Aphis craccivora]